MKSVEKTADYPKRVCCFHVYVFVFMKIFY
jgi:hypothetical protein